MSVTPETPQSREEKWLAVIAGFKDIEPEEPQFRIEKWLAYIAEHIGDAEEKTVVTTDTAVTLNPHETKIITGAPTVVTVTLSAPTVGKDYLTGVTFIAGANFALTETAPEGYSIIWPDLPTWTEGKLYEVIYRCLWLTDGNGKTMISAKFSEADVPQPEVSE